MKTIIFGAALVVVFFFGLNYEKQTKPDQKPANGDWIGWKNKHDFKPWELKK